MRPTTVCSLALVLATGCLDAEDDPLGATAQGLTGYQGASVILPYSPLPKDADVMCPPGMVGTSVMFGVDDGSDRLDDIAIQMEPIAADWWHVHVDELTGHPSWNLQGALRCWSPVPSFELASAVTPHDSLWSKQLWVHCPAGKVALGAGFAAHDLNNDRVVARLTYSMPSWDGRSWLMNATAFGGGVWRMQGSVTCADPADVPGYELVTSDSPTGMQAAEREGIWCPTGKLVSGTGWGVLDDTDAILEGTAYMELGAGRPRVRGVEVFARPTVAWSTLWKLRVTGICSP